MKELVELLARSLVEQPDQVVVNVSGDDRSVVIYLKVAQEDMGKVIGRKGRIARALRTMVKAAALKQNKKVILEIG
ncbi:MAG: KH domain-containing protein [Peptococcaceae bacterium]|nr:KH domain-containing protein [Peptococcaceae bacterium]